MPTGEAWAESWRRGVGGVKRQTASTTCAREQLLLILLNVARTQHGLPAATAAAAHDPLGARETNLIKNRAEQREQSRVKPPVMLCA